MLHLDENETNTNIHISQASTRDTMSSDKRCMLVTNEALHVLELENSLMKLNQLIHCGFQVQDTPHCVDHVIM